MNGKQRQKAIFCLLLVVAVLLAGCIRQPGPVPPEATTLAAETTPGRPDDQTGLDKGPSGTLRLWWDLQSPENPLLASSESSRAVYSLVFGQLFQIDANWQLQPELVQDFSYSEERLQLTVSLRPEATFQDQSPLQAADVLATLNEIQRLGALSPYAAALQAFSSGRLINDTTLVLQLARPDPAFLYALTFPVLKASEVAWPAGSLWQGTRLFQMAGPAEDGFLLRRVSSSPANEPRLQTILVKTYASATLAMRGLEDDKLDLVLLPTDDLYQYQMRSSLRLDRFTSRTFTFFSFGRQISDPKDQLRYKYFLRTARWAKAGKAWPGQTSEVPIPAFHACFQGQPLDLSSSWPEVLRLEGLVEPLPQSGSSAPLPAEATVLAPRPDELKIIVPANQPLLWDLARQAATWLELAGQTAVVMSLPAADFSAALVSGDFGLAFQTARLPASAEPSWFLATPVASTGTSGEGLPEATANRYDEGSGDLALGWPFFTFLGSGMAQDEEWIAATASQYRQVLTDLVFQVQGGGILLGEGAIAYGDRVIGQGQPLDGQPYHGIEELWIWSGS